jgi:hypothetical protein
MSELTATVWTLRSSVPALPTKSATIRRLRPNAFLRNGPALGRGAYDVNGVAPPHADPEAADRPFRWMHHMQAQV